MAGELDDAVQNVQKFNSLLADVNARLDTVSDAFDAFAKHLADVEDTTEQDWNQLSEVLRSLVQTAGTADEVAGELDSLATVAGELAGGRLGSVDQELDGAEDGLTSHIHNANNSLTQRFDGVESQGFDGAQAKIAQSVSGIEAAQTELDSDVTAAANALVAADTEVSGAAADLAQSLTEANTAVDEAEARIESAAQAATTSGSAAEEAAGTEQGALTGLYEAFNGKLEEATHKLAETVNSLGPDTNEVLGTTVKEAVETQVQSDATEPAKQWDTEVVALEGVLKTGEDETRELPGLVKDLEIAKRKLPELQQVLDAMET